MSFQQKAAAGKRLWAPRAYIAAVEDVYATNSQNDVTTGTSPQRVHSALLHILYLMPGICT